MMLCSSTVMMRRHSRAAVRMMSSSMGLMVGMLMTRMGDALALGPARRRAVLGDHQAGGDDRDIVAVGELFALADLELIGRRIVENRRGQAAEAQVDGAVVIIGRR